MKTKPTVKATPSARPRRRVEFGGIVYYARQEALKKDGGDPPRQWYWTVEDPKGGLCIDERVPGDYSRTLTAAHLVLAQHLGCSTEDLR